MHTFNSKEFLNHISLDCVVFGFHENQLKVLLLHMKYSNSYALPGGFIGHEETIETAAQRVLFERTGLDNIFLQQFRVFSNPHRADHNQALVDLTSEGIASSELEWFNQRFISIGFYALVNPQLATLQPDLFSDFCIWQPVQHNNELMIDHHEILNEALKALRLQIKYQPIGFNLLPEKFTMPELQKLYEAILGKSLDRRNFQRKILSYNILNRLEVLKEGKQHKAPYLYEFNIENYRKALNSGLQGDW